MASLKTRISRLKALGLKKASELGTARPGDAGQGVRSKAFDHSAVPFETAVEPLPGWTALGLAVQTRTIPTGLILPESSIGGFYPSAFQRAKSLVAGRPDPPQEYQKLTFFDLETTGLSGGTGTLAFLAALGYFEGRDFLVTQVLIDDYPGEPVFLDFIASVFAQHPWAVTYNGATFDMPLLRTRFIMNGTLMPELDHIDLLKQARRLWRRSLGSCSLKAIEEGVLSFEREGDIPGFLIPRIWLDYSAGGKERRGEGLDSLLKVFEHNVQDVISLARLFLKVENIMKLPLDATCAAKVHLPSLALELIGRGRYDEGMELLEAGGGEGDQLSLHILARLYRRAGVEAEYRRVVEAMDPGTVSGCVAKAKLSEHRIKDYRGAIAWAERALMVLENSKEGMPREKFETQSQALSFRLARLMLRLGSPGQP
ncbi:MAG: ribonuclease H-like domain-containing protein [Spirochaetes bacterium]|nr:ribonuclease H-like domain-containing protein [Spirochaetota bacterium]